MAIAVPAVQQVAGHEQGRHPVVADVDQLVERGVEPFMKYLVPSAALVLKQGFGRLIRTRSDAGVVALLDGRIMRRRYGATLLASLPRLRAPKGGVGSLGRALEGLAVALGAEPGLHQRHRPVSVLHQHESLAIADRRIALVH